MHARNSTATSQAKTPNCAQVGRDGLPADCLPNRSRSGCAGLSDDQDMRVSLIQALYFQARGGLKKQDRVADQAPAANPTAKKGNAPNGSSTR